MAETHTKCQERDCDNRASGIWRILKPDGSRDAALLCANCGMYAYAKRRQLFSPGLRVRLFKTLGTKFVQSQHEPQLADKHWDEHTEKPQARLGNGMTASEILNARAHKLGTDKSAVHPSILNQYRRD